LRACGLARGGDDGLELLREAVQTLERGQAPVELARALTDYGGALRRAGRRVVARGQLERALDIAHHQGAQRIAGLAREELVTAGAKPRRDAITGRDALTPGELRAVRLAIEGLTNREIAQALFVTAKTVDTHLSHAYAKLNISSRHDLADALDGRPDRDDGRLPTPQPPHPAGKRSGPSPDASVPAAEENHERHGAARTEGAPDP
jgi:DNA-binding CsgD family transcriptional regulator